MTFQQAMAATSRELNARATITCVDAFVISNTPVMSFSVEEGGQVTLGSVTSSRYTLSLPNGGGEWLKNGSILGNRSLTGARVQLQIGVYHDGAWDWQNAGLFIVEKTSAPEYGTAIKLIGNDPIISLDRVYDDQLAYRSTTTLGAILTHIKSKGVTITGSLACNALAIVNFQPDWGEEPTIRDALGYVLQMGGSLARCDRAGNITIAPANGSTTHAITTDKYTEFTDDERYFNFNRIKILPNGAKKNAAYVESYVTSAAESAANTLCLEGNPLFRTKTTTSYSSLSTAEEAAGLKNRKYYVKIGNKYEVVPEPVETSMTSYYKANTSYNTATLQTMADGLKTALTGMSFRAITFKWRGDPTVLVGDKVTLTDTRGVPVTTVILQQSLRYEGGFSAEISCPIDLTAVTPATLTSSGAWTPPYFGTGTIDGSVIMPNSLTGVQFADGSITNSQIKGGTITGTEIADSTITNSHFQDGTISGSIFEDGTINASKIDTSTFTNGSISGTAIDTSTFTNGSISGSVIDTSTFVDGTIDGSKITDSTIENSHFVAGTIEGSSIKGGTIDGTHIYNGTADNLKITNASIQNGAITTAKIQDAQITNAKIASAGIDFLKVKNSVLDTAIFREIVAGGDVYIDRLKVADANITNLTVGNLMVKRPDGTLHRIYVDGNGNLQTELVELLYQNLSSDALLKVSEWTVHKKETAPSSPYVGQLWVKPSTGIMQKCLTITPSVTWGDVKAGELHTSYIDAVTKGLNILTGGELNVLGGSVNIKSLDGVANVINMDNTGMTLSSTGQLKLQSTDSIIIGGSPFSVGGANLIPNGGFEDDRLLWSFNVPQSSVAISSGLDWEGRGLQISNPAGITSGGAYLNLTHLTSPLRVGQEYIISLWASSQQSWALSCNAGSTTPTVITAGGWRRFEYRFTATTDTGMIYILVGPANDGNSIWIDNVQLEKGTVATDWSPSPQDTVDALDALDGRLGTAETSLTGKTKIWYQSAIPVSTSIGDVWYKTDATPSVIVYRAESVGADAIASGEWVDITDSTLSKALTGLDILGDGVVQVFEGAALPTAADVMVGDMWLYTGTDTTTKKNGSMYRAVVTGADDLSEWTAFTAGAVITPYISLSANELHIDGAASLVVENSTNGNGITMNSTGMTIASGSKLAISATDLMISGKTVETYASDKISLSVSNIKVGGRNLVRNGGFDDDRMLWSPSPAGTEISFSSGVNYTGRGLMIQKPSTQAGGGGYFSFGNLTKPLVVGQEYVLSFWKFSVHAWALSSTAFSPGVVIPEGGWMRIEHKFTATANTGGITIGINLPDVAAGIRIDEVQIEEGNKGTQFNPAPEDPASGVKTSYIDIATDHIDISTGGNINLSAGAKLSAKAGTIQLEAANASGSVLQFGDALNISEGSSGYQLSINSATNDAIRVNNNPVWHKGNIVVQQAQPASGNGVIWVKPLAGTATVNYLASLSTKLEYAGGGTRSWTLSNTTGDTMSAAGTYTFAVTFKLQRTTINQRVAYINTTGGSIVLTKGAGSLTIALPALEFGPWWQHTVSVTGTTTSTAFTSGTGTISAAITLTGTPSYGGDDFIHHVNPSDITCKIDGPGASGTAQAVEIKFVP